MTHTLLCQWRAGLSAAAAMAFAVAAPAQAANWVPTWTASPQARWAPANPIKMNLPTISHQTLRQTARISLGGDRVRIVVSNEYGHEPLTVTSGWVAQAGPRSTIIARSGRALSFSGRRSVVIPAGAQMVSDAIELQTAPLSEISVSLFFPNHTPVTTFHWDARQTAYLAVGDVTDDVTLKPVATTLSRPFLSSILVERDPPSKLVVILGDSLTDGASATKDANTRWPDYLAARFAGRDIAVVNAGVSGGRVLKDGMGASALGRFDRDVLAQPNVAAVIVLLGINDISWPGSAFEPTGHPAEVGDLITGFRQLIARAHLSRVRIIGATLPPFRRGLEGTPIWRYYSPEKDRRRQALNRWIRESGEFDGVIDFDASLRDPKDLSLLRAEADGGDHLHPGDAGNKAMAELVDPALVLGDVGH